jgi:hypothetical protein
MDGLHDAADRQRLRDTLLAPLPTARPQPAASSRAAEVARFALLADPRTRGEVVLVR